MNRPGHADDFSSLQLTQSYDATLEILSTVLDLRDHEADGHARRVTELASSLAQALEVSEEERVHIGRGALLHDIGNLLVPETILHKQGELTAEEWVIIHMHPFYGFEILRSIPFLAPALNIAYCHHEKWDGTGYPRGIKGEQIPLAARIFAVVDVYDALTSDRPYRAAWMKEAALDHISRQAGKHFDAAVVQAFLPLTARETRPVPVPPAIPQAPAPSTMDRLRAATGAARRDEMPTTARSGPARALRPEGPVDRLKGLAAQIDSILQSKLSGTPLADRGIHLVDLPEGGVMVVVGGTRYAAVADVADPEIQAAIRAAIKEWEQKNTPG